MDRLILAGGADYAMAMPISSADLRVGGNALLKSQPRSPVVNYCTS